MSVYALVDPRTKVARYVGQSRKPRARLSQHLRNAHSSRLRGWLAELRSAGVVPELRMLDGATEREWILRLTPDLNIMHGAGGPRKTRALTIWLDDEQGGALDKACGDIPLSTWARAELLKAARAAVGAI